MSWFACSIMIYGCLQWSGWYLRLFMQKPLGLLSLLDEESTFPNGTDLTFANKLKQHLHSNSCFRGDRGKAFTVCHYAGEVWTLWTKWSMITFFFVCLKHWLGLSCWEHNSVSLSAWSSDFRMKRKRFSKFWVISMF